jgi:hypothetical protein
MDNTSSISYTAAPLPLVPAVILPLKGYMRLRCMNVTSNANSNMPHMRSLSLLHRAQISSPSTIIACMRFCWVPLLSSEPGLAPYQHLSSQSYSTGSRSRGWIEEEGWSKHSNSVRSTCTRGCIPQPKAFHWGAQIRGRSCLG